MATAAQAAPATAPLPRATDVAAHRRAGEGVLYAMRCSAGYVQAVNRVHELQRHFARPLTDAELGLVVGSATARRDSMPALLTCECCDDYFVAPSLLALMVGPDFTEFHNMTAADAARRRRMPGA